jgi:hypothetical protein
MPEHALLIDWGHIGIKQEKWQFDSSVGTKWYMVTLTIGETLGGIAKKKQKKKKQEL